MLSLASPHASDCMLIAVCALSGCGSTLEEGGLLSQNPVTSEMSVTKFGGFAIRKLDHRTLKFDTPLPWNLTALLPNSPSWRLACKSPKITANPWTSTNEVWRLQMPNGSMRG